MPHTRRGGSSSKQPRAAVTRGVTTSKKPARGLGGLVGKLAAAAKARKKTTGKSGGTSRAGAAKARTAAQKPARPNPRGKAARSDAGTVGRGPKKTPTVKRTFVKPPSPFSKRRK